MQEEIEEVVEEVSSVEYRGDQKINLNYTNRRNVRKTTDADTNKSIMERKRENEEEYEIIHSQLQKLSVSDSSSRETSAVKKTNNTVLKSSCNNNKHPEVEAFQRFLDNEGGHYGGWKEKDHLFFIKTRKKYPVKKTAEIVHENFPDISTEKVLAHEVWYNEYLKLKNAKRRAIEEWKKNQKICLKVDEEKTTPNQEQSEPKPQPKRDPLLKEKIEIWKAHCIAAKLERKEEQRKEEMRKKKEEEERKKAQEEKRALVNRYREEKISLELAIKTAKEAEELQAKREAAVKATTLLKYFRYEDRRFTERQKAKRHPPVKSEPRVKSAVEVKRDPNRLLQPTLGWIYHTQRNSDEDTVSSTTTLLDLSHMPRLKKPLWRQGITSP